MPEPARRQRTLRRPAGPLRGPGLHSGEPGAVTLLPAPAGTGIVFRRADRPGDPDIPARAASIADTHRCTTLAPGGATRTTAPGGATRTTAAGGASVRTVEHLLAACAFAGLDNALVAVEGGELPAADGSALLFLDLIEAAGLEEQDAPIVRHRLAAPLEVASPGGGRVRAEPAEAASFAFTFRGGGGLDGRTAAYTSGRDEPRAVAAARTFCFESEIAALKAAGLGAGGTAENCLVLRADGTPVNAARFPDEPVRHKLLDLIGDLMLAGGPLAAAVRAEGSGHALHAEFVRALAAQEV